MNCVTRIKDPRPFIRVADEFTHHPRVARLTGAAFVLLIYIWTTAARERTGHHIKPEHTRYRGYKARKQLEEAGLIARDGDLWVIDQEFLGPPHHKNSRPAIPKSLRDSVYIRDNWKCVTCGTADDLSLDHIWPWSLGGEDTFENFQTLCRSCNSKKGARV